MANKITKRNSFIEFMLAQIELLQDSNRFGTAQNYKSTLNSFNSFLNFKYVPFRLYHIAGKSDNNGDCLICMPFQPSGLSNVSRSCFNNELKSILNCFDCR